MLGALFMFFCALTVSLTNTFSSLTLFSYKKSLIDKHPEVIGLIRSYKKKTSNISNIKISKLLESEHGIKVHSSNIPKVLKDHDLRIREERNRRRRKTSKTESI